VALITIRCTNCRSSIQLDSAKDSEFCYYCGSPIVLGDEIMKRDNPIDASEVAESEKNLSVRELLERTRESFRRLEQAADRVPKEYRSVRYFYLVDGPQGRRFLFDLHSLLILHRDEPGTRELNEKYEALKVRLRIEQQETVQAGVRAIWTLVGLLAVVSGVLLVLLLAKVV